MREQTPPLLKWLLVERATLAGDIARSLEREAALIQELERGQERYARLGREIARLQTRKMELPQILAEEKNRLAALDTAIRAASDDHVSPDVAGTVRAFSVQYRKRGDLKAFIIQVLQEAAPNPVDTPTVLQRAIDHFGLDFATKAEHQAFRGNTLKRQLLLLKEEGLVEALHNGHARQVGVWRWKKPFPSFADIAALAAA